MSRMKSAPIRRVEQEGSSLLEALIALSILAMALLFVFGAMSAFTAINTRNQARTNAAIAARTRMEELRFVDPAAMPATGSHTSAASVGPHQFTIVTLYCSAGGYCDDNTRHVVVRVKEDGKQLFATETVLTQLR